MLECVVNISEGRDRRTVDAIASAAGGCLLDVHSDPDHHRSVLTLAGAEDDLERAVRGVAAEAVDRIDLRRHDGVHPRLGAVDVVPFVPLAGTTFDMAVVARDRFATWAADALDVPCFVYGPGRSLPEVRREAFRSLAPDTGPAVPHPTAGATCVGARPVLVAYNLWLAPGTPVESAQRMAAAMRSPSVRALGLAVGDRVQVSLNLVDPLAFGPADAHDAVAAVIPVEAAELVGLLPTAVLEAIPEARWASLDVAADRTIDSRLRR
ncbi:MAG: hypothetical protein ACRD12_09690 [Acidimicrobiales bacterium]